MPQTIREHATQERRAALLLPGMSLNASIFPDLGMPTVSPDLARIELGENGITPELERRGFEAYRALVNTELAHAGCWSNARRIVVAHSFGGMLALSWLLEDRREELSKIHGLVLIATTAGPMYRRVRMRVRYPWVGAARIPVGWLIPLWNTGLVTRTVKRTLCGGRLGKTPTDFSSIAVKSDADLGRAGWRNTDWRAMRAFRFTMAGYDVRARLFEIAVPTVVLHGTEDSLFDIEDARLLSRQMPNAELRLVHGAGHALPVTHGHEVVRAVEDLLAD